MHRSYLFAPGHNEKLLAGCSAPARTQSSSTSKTPCRPPPKSRHAARSPGARQRPAWVRINAVRTELAAADLDAVAGVAAGIRIPKVESPQDAQWVSAC